MQRREFIAGLGSMAAWPVGARAQRPKMPVIGYLSPRSSEADAAMLAAFRRGLTETGYVEGRNVAIEYRFANGERDSLPTLFTELTRQQVAVIVFPAVVMSGPGLQLIQTSQIPIVFNAGLDPVRHGLVASFNRPGGNVTSVYTLTGGETVGKHISLVRELVPNATTIAVLVEPVAGLWEDLTEYVRRAAASLGLELVILNASTESEINAVFANIEQRRPDAFLVISGPLFQVHAKHIVALAARLSVPAIYPRREYADAGGLMSYGYDVADGYRQMGIYAGRILKGEKPTNLPVVQPTRFQFVINLKTARALGLTVPPNLLAIADEVIE
jgi:putative ABC transport system substrate-binding protein